MAGPFRLPILVYHDVRLDPLNIYDLGVDDFAGHLDLIERSGWSTVSLAAFLDWQKEECDIPPRSLVLTFDDGYASHFSAVFPMLAARGMSAAFFISAGMIGREGYMSMAQVARMGGEGMEIGSHGLSHRPLIFMDDAGLERELSLSRSLLEDALERRVDLFSAPRGLSNRRLREFALRAGYRAVCTSRIAFSRRSSDPLDLGRIWVRGPADIEAVLEGGRLRFALQRSMQMVREAARGMIGYGPYNRLRRALLGARAEKED